jgi:hypothetical protein
MIKAVIIEPIRNVYMTGFDASGFTYDEGATRVTSRDGTRTSSGHRSSGSLRAR